MERESVHAVTGGRRGALVAVFRAIGAIELLVGAVAAYYGPLEIYVFYLFSEGGPFHYDGFGVGSLWFGALVAQNVAYYVLAAMLIPVGIGTLRLRRWARTLSTLYLWGWLAAGVLCVGNLIVLAPPFLRLGPPSGLRFTIVGAVTLVFLVLVPGTLLRLSKSNSVRSVFETRSPTVTWIERVPSPLLALLFLFACCIIGLHLAIFFQATFPWFGELITGRPAMPYLASSIVILSGLMIGTLRLRVWAWWGALAYVSLLTVSVIVTFSRYTVSQIVGIMDVPAYELALFRGATVLHDYRPVWLLAPPLLLMVGLLLYSRRTFAGGDAFAWSRSDGGGDHS